MLHHFIVIHIEVVAHQRDHIAHQDDSVQVHHLDDDFQADEVEVEEDEVDGKKYANMIFNWFFLIFNYITSDTFLLNLKKC